MADAPLDDRGLPQGYDFHDEHEITPREVAELIEDDEVVIVDVREESEIRTASVNNTDFVHFPLGSIAEHHEDLADDLNEGQDTPVVVLCHHGVRSLRATLALREFGFTNVKSVAGGIDLWSRDIDTAVPRY